MVSCGQVTIETEPSFDPNLVTIDGCVDLPSTIQEGQGAAVTLTASNQNDSAANVDVSILGNGSQIEQDTFTVPANSQGHTAELFINGDSLASLGGGTHEIEAEKAGAQQLSGQGQRGGFRNSLRADGGSPQRQLGTCSSCR